MFEFKPTDKIMEFLIEVPLIKCLVLITVLALIVLLVAIWRLT